MEKRRGTTILRNYWLSFYMIWANKYPLTQENFVVELFNPKKR